MSATIKCPACLVDVPLDKLNAPNRCHSFCPLNSPQPRETKMSLFKPAEPTSAYLKMGLLGDPGAGKTYTGADTMIGLVLYARSLGLDYASKPVFFFDTETGSDWVIDKFKKANVPLFVAKRRSFADLLVAVKEAETNASGLLIDSITHPWRELCESYMKKKQRTYLQIDDWGYLKGNHGWAQFTDAFVNSRLHVIMCGRAGDRFNDYIDEDGRRKMEKIGTKMRTESETAYEPSLLVLMKQVEDARTKKVTHRAVVQKDRSTLLDAMEFDNPGFESFKPHIEKLNLGGAHVGVSIAGDSQHILKTEKRDWEPVQREICIDEVQTLLMLHYPSQSAEDKKNKLKAILKQRALKSAAPEEQDAIVRLLWWLVRLRDKVPSASAVADYLVPKDPAEAASSAAFLARARALLASLAAGTA